ncbi:hypothetical protein J3F83DRAFT_724268 [Trichoderma novae-zelandiae]
MMVLTYLGYSLSVRRLPPSADASTCTEGQTNEGSSLETLHVLAILSRAPQVPCSGPGASQSRRPSQVLVSHQALFHLLRPTDPGTIARGATLPRRAAAAIVAKSPFQQARPVSGTLVWKRAATTYSRIANPRVHLAPDATSYHKGSPRLLRQSLATM